MTASVFQAHYGGKAARALAGNVGALVRRQEILTPGSTLCAAAEALGGAIVLDPCASSDPAAWFATHNVTLPPEAVALDEALAAADAAGDKAEVKRLKKAVQPYYLAGALAESWDGLPAFVNPPFAFLEEWLAKVASETGPVVLLGPARVRRSWWWEHGPNHPRCTSAVFLTKVRFCGYKQDFTEPCALLGYGCTIPLLGAQEAKRLK
jgi:hypothetical protein